MAISTKEKKQYETLWAFMTAQKGLVFKMITEVLNEHSLFNWEREELYQELAISLVKLTPGKEWRTIKNRIRTIIQQKLNEMKRIEFYLEQELANDEEEYVSAYIDRLKIEYVFDGIEDDTIEDVKEFCSMFGAEHRAVIKYLLLGYNVKEIAVRLKKSIPEIAKIIQEIRIIAGIYFNVDPKGVEYTFDYVR